MATKRIYLVTGPDGNKHLVKATHQAAALRHVADSRYKVDVASQDDLVSAVTAGVKVETAGEPAEPSPRLDGIQTVGKILTGDPTYPHHHAKENA